MDATHQIDELANEYVRRGKTTLVFVGVFLLIFGVLAFPGLRAFVDDLPRLAAEAKRNSAAYSAIGGMVAAILGVAAALSGPVLMLLVGGFLRRRTHYNFCKRSATFIAFYRPFGEKLSEKTLVLLEDESVRRNFS